jgi:hypothetical protein
MSKNRAKIEQLKELVEALGIALSAAKATSDRYESVAREIMDKWLAEHRLRIDTEAEVKRLRAEHQTCPTCHDTKMVPCPEEFEFWGGPACGIADGVCVCPEGNLRRNRRCWVPCPTCNPTVLPEPDPYVPFDDGPTDPYDGPSPLIDDKIRQAVAEVRAESRGPDPLPRHPGCDDPGYDECCGCQYGLRCVKADEVLKCGTYN